MIEQRQVQNLAQTWQTTTDNVVCEYFQQLFLSYLYQEKGSDGLLFKGGTALRIVWHSPRFGDKAGESTCYTNLGAAYRSLGDFRKAIEYSLKAERIFKELGQIHYLKRLYKNLSLSYEAAGDYANA